MPFLAQNSCMTSIPVPPELSVDWLPSGQPPLIYSRPSSPPHPQHCMKMERRSLASEPLVKQRQQTPPQGLLKGLNEATSENVWHTLENSQLMLASFSPSCTLLFSHMKAFALSKHTRSFTPPIILSHCFTCVLLTSATSLCKNVMSTSRHTLNSTYSGKVFCLPGVCSCSIVSNSL